MFGRSHDRQSRPVSSIVTKESIANCASRLTSRKSSTSLTADLVDVADEGLRQLFRIMETFAQLIYSVVLVMEHADAKGNGVEKASATHPA